MEKLANLAQNEMNKTIGRILKGSIVAIILTIVLLFLFACMLTYTQMSETTIKPVVFVITGISILIGSSLSAIRIKKRGLINGGIVGLIYILTIYLLSSIMFTGFVINTSSLILILVGIIAGMIGGMIGVNIK